MTIASEISRLQNDKAAICTAIENKGVTVGNVTLDDYASCIDAIQTGGGVGYIDFLMVGGGGAGGGNQCCYIQYSGGGGGGGGFVEKFCQAVFGRGYEVRIGKGGCGTCGCINGRGGDTLFYGVAYGGGGENYGYKDCCCVERKYFINGASGAGWEGQAIHGTQGNNGGKNSSYAGGGGGGAGSAGCNASSCKGGDGGAGKCSSMSGELQWYSGGGGGGSSQSGSCQGCGGCGGGGDGNYYNCGYNCNATYYGGGGGGVGRYSGNAGNGCQGIVIIRYKADGSCGFSSATGGDCCYLCNGYCIHTFVNDGIFTPII